MFQYKILGSCHYYTPLKNDVYLSYVTELLHTSQGTQSVSIMKTSVLKCSAK
jgi:hypothetical protein